MRLARLMGATRTSAAQGHMHQAERRPSWAVLCAAAGCHAAGSSGDLDVESPARRVAQALAPLSHARVRAAANTGPAVPVLCSALSFPKVDFTST